MLLFEPWEQFARLANYNPLEVLVEIIIIWTVIFVVWRFVEGTRAAGAVRGIIVLVLISLLLRLLTPGDYFLRLAYLYDNFLGFAALALVIIFQPELRRAVIRLGETSIFRQTGSEIAPVVDALVLACSFLSKNKFGAIIAIERQVGLRETIEGGRPLNADISAELLQSIFWPNNPLHDMAVVIRGNRIIAAGVQFPLADPHEMSDPRLGTRHRAAVGLTRHVDALVIVVSEETGSISLSERGTLERWLTPEALRAELTRRLTINPPRSAADDPGEDNDDGGEGMGGKAA